ncbi:type III secretion system needle filament subunit SctF [Chromobacterium violaceum]|uniref:type III secretion system needle filament subunit SctF n=1 Tax=Chromobacterium violaceum TaxID=536 RepID=UPI001BE9460A|nr:type III secretion system needle filament subunit SctF [Chromobacterium violaceum]MBT2869678.1 type III secretion system needle filament subunit SctF [Chromobacterium violaceum]
MNLDAIVAQMGSQVDRVSNDAETAIQSDVLNDARSMLNAQFAMQQYSVMIGYESAVMKSIKDMMMGIISKI